MHDSKQNLEMYFKSTGIKSKHQNETVLPKDNRFLCSMMNLPGDLSLCIVLPYVSIASLKDKK